MGKKTDSQLKFQKVLDEFLKEREWTDEYEIDNEEQTVSLNSAINICEGHSGRLIIEASDRTDCVNVYIYITTRFARKQSLLKWPFCLMAYTSAGNSADSWSSKMATFDGPTVLTLKAVNQLGFLWSGWLPPVGLRWKGSQMLSLR